MNDCNRAEDCIVVLSTQNLLIDKAAELCGSLLLCMPHELDCAVPHTQHCWLVLRSVALVAWLEVLQSLVRRGVETGVHEQLRQQCLWKAWQDCLHSLCQGGSFVDQQVDAESASRHVAQRLVGCRNRKVTIG